MIRSTLGALGAFTVALAAVPAYSQVDTSDWNCEYCPFADGYEAEVEVGATEINADAARFGNATGYDEEGTYANVDGRGSYAGGAYRFGWMAEDLGLDSRVFAMEGGRPGSFGFNLAYSELPYRLFGFTRTPYSASGNDALLLPSGWVAASRTQNMPGLSAALARRPLARDRQIFDAGVDIEALSNFSFYADYRRQQRDGVQILGGSSFFQAVQLPRIVDDQTDTVDAGIRYSGGSFSLTVAWFGSFFMNQPLGLTWDNPFGGFADQNRHALEPDNDFQQISVSGSYIAEALNTVIAFTAASGRGKQDDDLLAYTINPGVAAPGLPRSTLDAEVDTTNYALTITSRPFARARVKLGYRYDERDNQTPQDTWSRVVVDGFLSPGSDENVPYSFERSTLTLDGSYRLFDSVRLSGGYERREVERDFQEVAEQTEDTGYGQLRWRPTAALEMKLRGGAARRDIDRYDETFAQALGQNPLLRKYHLAYRYREFGELTLGLSPAGKSVSASLHARYADDSYSRSRLGLLASDSLYLGADLSWAPGERSSFYLFVSDEAIEAEQAGSSNFAVPDWRARHDDDFITVGAGFRIRDIGGKFDLKFDYASSDGESEIIVDPFAGATSEFPELESLFDDYRLTLTYRSSDRLAWHLNLRYQLFETEDWAIEGLRPNAAPSLLSLGAAPYDEDVLAAGIGIRYGFGGTDAEQ